MFDQRLQIEDETRQWERERWDREGRDAFAAFGKAVAQVQALFWEKVGERTELEHRAARQWEREAAELGFSSVRSFYEAVYGPWDRRFQPWTVRLWDDRWRRRAAKYADWEERGRKHDPDFDRDHERLLMLEASTYVERLTGEEVPRSGKIHCPLPGHDERTPSFHCRETRWRCFGCGQKGSIYDLAGELWGLKTYGREFVEIHRRLVEVFG